ncbi:MAG: hypothetical protein A3B70_07685 [Deltaproteobacteria bacterium RIFCSPHIGHO2_02_FULL_40_11]|nr:MAG: hypothetical protein A3B70_07685 [Deltaproteobacteria bacterium RIFCSPHIGHO2_02_FULL_40_11]
MKDAIIVFVTTASKKEAQNIAKILLQEKLAACAQILPQMESFYMWQGKIQRDKEFLMLIKSRKKLFLKLEKTIQKHHAYETPQIVALPFAKASDSYLKWMTSCLASK